MLYFKCSSQLPINPAKRYIILKKIPKRFYNGLKISLCSTDQTLFDRVSMSCVTKNDLILCMKNSEFQK